MNASDPDSPTIAALATSAGPAAVALVRISGPASLAVADRATGGRASRARAREAVLCKVRDAGGRVLDDVLLTVFRAPHSYTGEDVVEIAGHGGTLVSRKLLERVLACGAEPAGPGEFTKRAFLNRKLDLTQAEAVMDLISAQTELGLRAAREQLAGRIGILVEGMRAELISVVAHVEAYIDFPEEDIAPETGAKICKRICGLVAGLDSLLDTAARGRILRHGVRTVICGAPNVGKSSLLNRLLGYDRAIVSATPGTTRDTIEEVIDMAGVPLRLVDTAGVHDAGDPVEREGIGRTLREIGAADLLIEVADATLPAAGVPVMECPAGCVRLRVLNKCDLGEHPDWQGTEATRLSCLDGSGFGVLEDAIREALHLAASDWGDHAVAINVRHQTCLRRAKEALEAALAGMETPGGAPEFAAADLREALDGLGEITGRVDVEEILGHIFSTFCIGK